MYTPNCDIFWVGSYPMRDPLKASRGILANPSMLLHWPQLPKKGTKERFFEQTYSALATPGDGFPKGAASGWNAMWRALKTGGKKIQGREHFKTQLAGPLTLFGKLLSGKQKDELELRQYVTLWLKHAYWQIEVIREHGFRPILVMDEPLLPTYVAKSDKARKALKLMRSIVTRLRKRGALVGVHCCNRISPAVLIDLGVDLIHLDAYYFPTQIARARSELQKFLSEGGVLAWGVVPITETLTPTALAKLEKNFTGLLGSLETRSLPLRAVLAQSMVAPTCGTGLLSSDHGEKILEYTAALSRQLKARYKLL